MDITNLEQAITQDERQRGFNGKLPDLRGNYPTLQFQSGSAQR